MAARSVPGAVVASAAEPIGELVDVGSDVEER
jgi:hypothetical protein